MDHVNSARGVPGVLVKNSLPIFRRHKLADMISRRQGPANLTLVTRLSKVGKVTMDPPECCQHSKKSRKDSKNPNSKYQKFENNLFL